MVVSSRTRALDFSLDQEAQFTVSDLNLWTEQGPRKEGGRSSPPTVADLNIHNATLNLLLLCWEPKRRFRVHVSALTFATKDDYPAQSAYSRSVLVGKYHPSYILQIALIKTQQR